MVFGDESAYDKRSLSRRYGWSLAGTRAKKPSFFIRGQRFTIEGALCIDGLLAYGIQEGPMNTNDFEDFIEYVLVYTYIVYNLFFIYLVNNLNNILIVVTKDEPVSWTI